MLQLDVSAEAQFKCKFQLYLESRIKIKFELINHWAYREIFSPTFLKLFLIN